MDRMFVGSKTTYVLIVHQRNSSAQCCCWLLFMTYSCFLSSSLWNEEFWKNTPDGTLGVIHVVKKQSLAPSSGQISQLRDEKSQRSEKWHVYLHLYFVLLCSIWLSWALQRSEKWCVNVHLLKLPPVWPARTGMVLYVKFVFYLLKGGWPTAVSSDLCWQ